MIEIRRACLADIGGLLDNPHDMTRDELRALGLKGSALDRHMYTRVGCAAAHAVLIDGRVAALAGSTPQAVGLRATFFMAAKCDPRKLVLGARVWAAREREEYAGSRFCSFSYSTHPKRDRFMRALGMRKLGEAKGFAVFTDSD